ncbi:MAG: TIGR03986 family CRISPR-associated RAMP protein [Bryobacterales bacterium]|nr:TIGR03986 family CRISPR-associated RAMP protein [Bryobacterales bacterium]
MKLERGILVVTQTGKNKPPRIQVQIGGKMFNVAQGEVSQSVLDRLSEMNGREVEFERVGGQPKKIREAGGEFVPPSGPGRALRSPVWGAQAVGAAERSAQRGAPRHTSGETAASQSRHFFYNPYNFVPAPPRKIADAELGDGAPVMHDQFHAHCYTGCIRVRMTAVTPLVVPDPASARCKENDHWVFPLRQDGQGRPLIAASSVRGMLRSAYEAITNSRFCRFSEAYKSRLGYRMEARQGLSLIPARIAGGHIELLTGTSKVGANGAPQGPMYAAWLPRYRRGRLSASAVRYENGELPQHGDEVDCRIELVTHHSGKFQYWAVREIRRAAPGNPEDGWVRGWVCVTNANINRKHDERVFFIDPQQGQKLGPFPLTAALREQWKQLIADYRKLHEDDLAERKKRQQRPDEYLGDEPGRTAWSRHVYEAGYEELRDGTLCYARLSSDKGGVEALFPVMISRELYACSPWDLLDASLRPAERIQELSPADRVWGWVRTQPLRGDEELHTAVRGRVRVGPVRCESEDAAETFPQELPLAILSAPKPQQGRFYVAKNKAGQAQKDGLSRIEAGYSKLGTDGQEKGLRGRKVYPHHAGLPPSHWANPLEDRTQQGPPYQEYRRPRDANGKEQQDNQNRSILGWVKPGAEFTFELYVENLSRVELGALLWLLRLPDEHYVRIGGGRPLGFGSVRLEIKDWDLREPQGLKSWYSAWVEPQPLAADPNLLDEAVSAFQEAVLRAYGRSSERFENIPFIKSFLAACRGFPGGLPVHYPRVTPEPGRSGENYQWFVENERQGRYALPDLAGDPKLPLLQASPRGGA